jgi:putative membrane protein
MLTQVRHVTPGWDGAIQLGVCWAAAVVWLIVLLFSAALAGTPAGAQASGIQALILALVVVMHARLSYGWKGLCVYVLVVSTIAFSCEACSIATGFPFGYFQHNVSAGPKPLGVPLTVAMGYVVLGWFAWTLARLIARDTPYQASGLERFTTPIVASFILAGFDFPADPIGSAVLNIFSYRHPSGQFGVPLKNYLGWLLTGWLFFQVFAFVEQRFRASSAVGRRAFWLLPCVVWSGLALQFPLLLAAAPAGTAEVGGRSFVIADIYEAAVAGSLLTMALPIILALIKLAARRPLPTSE